MNRTGKFIYNSIAAALLQIVTFVAGLITPRVMLISYGSEINGLVTSITQFISYFNLVEAGLSGAAVYALYKPLADNNYRAISGIVSAAKKFYTQSGYIFLSLILGLAFTYPVIVEIQELPMLYVSLLVVILGINGALEFFTLAKYRAILTADQRSYVISVASLAHVVLNTVIIVVLANFGVHIVILRLVALLSILLRSLILMIYVRIKYSFIDYKETPDESALNKRWDALYLQILGVIHTGAPVVIITLVLKDMKLVSIYTVYNMVIAGIGGLLGIFISGLSASFGDVIARDEQYVLQKAYREFEFAYYSLLTIVYSVTFVTIMPFVRIYTEGVTDTNYDLSLIGFLFVLNGLLYNIKTPQGMLVISAGLYKETKWQTTIQGVIAVFGGAFLANFWGIPGVLSGTILSNVYRDIDLLFFIPRNVTKLPIRKTLYRMIRVFTCIVIICIPFFFTNYDPDGYKSWLTLAINVGVIAFLVVIICGFIFDHDDMISTGRRILLVVRRVK